MYSYVSITVAEISHLTMYVQCKAAVKEGMQPLP